MSFRFSLIIPTLDEARRLAFTLKAARAAFGDAAEYIVSDGGSSDSSREIAVAGGARVVAGPRGRGQQLQRGVADARGEICVFLHADTELPPNARAAIESALELPAVVGGAFCIAFPGVGWRLRLLQRAINLRARVFGSATGDQVIFVRRRVLDEIGGVPQVPLFEDLRLCRALRRKGKFVILAERVVTSARLWQEIGTARGVLLHLSLRALHALGASPVVLARYYPSPR